MKQTQILWINLRNNSSTSQQEVTQDKFAFTMGVPKIPSLEEKINTQKIGLLILTYHTTWEMASTSLSLKQESGNVPKQMYSSRVIAKVDAKQKKIIDQLQIQ